MATGATDMAKPLGPTSSGAARAVALPRVSTPDQVAREISFLNQHVAIESWCRRDGVELVRTVANEARIPALAR